MWLPEEQLLITMTHRSSDDGGDVPLRVIQWEGPQKGPYHLLSLNKVPGNIMPKSPGYDLKELHNLMNSLFRKLANQARQQKTIIGYRPGSEGDAMKIGGAKDMEIIPVEDPSSIVPMEFAGPSNNNLAMALQVDQWFDRLAGNLTGMGGLGPQSETAAQDSMIMGQITGRVAQMTEDVLDAAGEVAKHLGWMLWETSDRTLRATREIPGTGIEIPIELPPYDRQGEFIDMNFTIEPYSMAHQSPQSRASSIMEMMNMAVSMAPVMAQQGMQIKFAEFFQLLARYRNLPEINHIIEYGQMIPEEQKQPEGPRQSPNTTRHHVRTNVSGTTQAGQAAEVASAALKGGSDGVSVGGS